MRRVCWVVGVFFGLVLLLAPACESEGGSGGSSACHYEVRKTSCGSSSYGDWEEGCAAIDFELRDDLTPASFCQQAYPSSDSHCAGGCCKKYQYRNVRVESGGC